MLHVVAIAAAFLLLDDVAGLGQVVDDAIGTAFRDADGGGDITEAHLGIVGDAQQRPAMIGEEHPTGGPMVAVGWVTNSIACHMRPMLSLASAGSVMGT